MLGQLLRPKTVMSIRSSLVFLYFGTRCIRDNERLVDFVVNWLCYSLQEDIDQQMYTDTRSYSSKIMTDVMSNMQVNNVLQIQFSYYTV